jgi:hypothetical protein
MGYMKKGVTPIGVAFLLKNVVEFLVQLPWQNELTFIICGAVKLYMGG